MNRGFSIQAPPFFIEDYILERPFAMDKQETHLAAAETLSQSVLEQPEHFFDPFRKEVRPVEAVRHHAHLLTQPSAYEAVHNEAYDRLVEEIADKL